MKNYNEAFENELYLEDIDTIIFMNPLYSENINLIYQNIFKNIRKGYFLYNIILKDTIEEKYFKKYNIKYLR